MSCTRLRWQGIDDDTTRAVGRPASFPMTVEILDPDGAASSYAWEWYAESIDVPWDAIDATITPSGSDGTATVSLNRTTSRLLLAVAASKGSWCGEVSLKIT